MQCETDKATIDYEVHGEGRPILLLHGWTMDRRVEMFDYEKIFAARPGWRRIYPDLPGMGRPVAKAGLFDQDQVLPGRFVLAGTSLGAYLARAIAARRRSRIAGLLLRMPCIFAEDARRTLFQALVDDWLERIARAEKRARAFLFHRAYTVRLITAGQYML